MSARCPAGRAGGGGGSGAAPCAGALAADPTAARRLAVSGAVQRRRHDLSAPFLHRRTRGRRAARENPAAPRVRGKIGRQDKHPWTTVEPPHGPVEAAFLRPVLLGESIAPFRLLPLALGWCRSRGGSSWIPGRRRMPGTGIWRPGRMMSKGSGGSMREAGGWHTADDAAATDRPHAELSGPDSQLPGHGWFTPRRGLL